MFMQNNKSDDNHSFLADKIKVVYTEDWEKKEAFFTFNFYLLEEKIKSESFRLEIFQYYNDVSHITEKQKVVYVFFEYSQFVIPVFKSHKRSDGHTIKLNHKMLYSLKPIEGFKKVALVALPRYYHILIKDKKLIDNKYEIWVNPFLKPETYTSPIDYKSNDFVFGFFAREFCNNPNVISNINKKI